MDRFTVKHWIRQATFDQQRTQNKHIVRSVKPNTHRRRDENCFVASRRRRRCVHEFATTADAVPTDSAMRTSLQFCSQWHRSTIWRNIWRCVFLNIRISRVVFVNFYNFLNNDVIMPSLVSTGNCKLGHDCQRVCSHRRRDETRQFRLVGVGGVYWALDAS